MPRSLACLVSVISVMATSCYSSRGDSSHDDATDNSPDGVVPGSCDDEVEYLVAEMVMEYDVDFSCTAVVRLDYQSYELLGYQLFCGATHAVSEEDARAAAVADVVLFPPYTDFSTAMMLNDPDPVDAYVFYASPGDFGGVAVVSPYTGLTVFGGSIVWAGSGDIAYPTSWQEPDALGSGCPDTGAMETFTHYYLACEGVSDAQRDAAIGAVAGTALPAAMAILGSFDSVAVLCYARRVGLMDPTSAEWIVLLNGSG